VPVESWQTTKAIVVSVVLAIVVTVLHACKAGNTTTAITTTT